MPFVAKAKRKRKYSSLTLSLHILKLFSICSTQFYKNFREFEVPENNTVLTLSMTGLLLFSEKTQARHRRFCMVSNKCVRRLENNFITDKELKIDRSIVCITDQKVKNFSNEEHV